MRSTRLHRSVNSTRPAPASSVAKKKKARAAAARKAARTTQAQKAAKMAAVRNAQAAAAMAMAAAPVDPGLTPTGDNFVPIGQAIEAASQSLPAAPGSAQPAAPAAAEAPAATAAQPAAAQQPAAAAPDGSAPATKKLDETNSLEANDGLAKLKETFAESHDSPIVGTDGMVYMTKRAPEVVDGKIVLKYDIAGKIDKASGRMVVNPQFLDAQQPKKDHSGDKMVEVNGQYFYQTLAKGKDGSLQASLEPVSQEDLAAKAQQAKQQEFQQWAQNRQDWMSKLGTMGTLFKTVGYTGSMAEGLMRGPNIYTGKPAAHWFSGYMILQLLDAQSGGKLLPDWMKKGAIGTAIDWGSQAIFMLDIGNDVRVLSQAFPRMSAAMRTFTAPTTAAIKGVTTLAKKLGNFGGVNAAQAGANVATTATSGAMQAAAGVSARSAMLGGSSASQVAAAARVASVAANEKALIDLGLQLRGGAVTLVGAEGTQLAGKIGAMTPEGLVAIDKAVIHQAMKLTEQPLHGAAKLSQGITDTVHGGLGALSKTFTAFKMFGSIFGTVMGALNVGTMVKSQGVKSLVTTRDGIGALGSFLGGASFLGLMLLPYLPMAVGTATVVGASLSMASNVLNGVTMLNYAGLFGGGGFLDSQAVRAAFLIPPLTPIGLASLWFKNKEKKKKAEAKKLELKQQEVVATVKQLREKTAQALASGTQPQGAAVAKDGSLLIQTGISNDLSDGKKSGKGAGAGGGSIATEQQNRQLQLMSRPMLR